MMQGEFKRCFESLDEIFSFTERYFEREGIDEAHRYTVNLAIEELFTNMVKYNPAGVEEILLQMQHDDDALLVRLCDREAAPFDVTRPRSVNPDAPLEKREPGGLGLFLVQQIVDTLDYAYRDGVATVTFTRKLS